LAASAGQKFVLVAEGETTSQHLDYSAFGRTWATYSVITTTALSSPTIIPLYHPGINFLSASPSPTYSPGDGSREIGDAAVGVALFSLVGLGLGPSIAIIVVVSIFGLALLCCLTIGCYIVHRRRRRRRENQQQLQTIIHGQQNQQNGGRLPVKNMIQLGTQPAGPPAIPPPLYQTETSGVPMVQHTAVPKAHV
jgi:hypothetical protein